MVPCQFYIRSAVDNKGGSIQDGQLGVGSCSITRVGADKQAVIISQVAGQEATVNELDGVHLSTAFDIPDIVGGELFLA